MASTGKILAITGAVLAGVLIFSVATCMLCVGGVAHSIDKKQKEEAEAVKSGPATNITASSLVAAYKANEVQADSKYKGETLEVSGVVKSISKDILDSAYITLSGGDPVRSVQCYFQASEQSKLGSLNKGQSLTVRGRCEGVMMNVQLKDCVIVD